MWQKLFYIFLFYIAGISARAQIISPGANFSTIAKYGNDQVFIFGPGTYNGNVTAHIEAVSIDGNSNWDFQWFVLNMTTGNFDIIGSQSNTSSWAIDTITTPACYRIQMDNGVIDTAFQSWVLFHDFNIVITSKDDDDSLTFVQCGSFTILTEVIDFEGLKHYTPDSLVEFIFDNRDFQSNYSYNWEADKDNIDLPNDFETGHPYYRFRVNEPHYEDTRFDLTFTSFGVSRTDFVIYGSIEPKAQLLKDELVYISLTDENYYNVLSYTDSEGVPRYIYEGYNVTGGEPVSAPLKVLFINDSKNADVFIWNFGDNSIPVITFNKEDTMEFDYLLSGDYKFRLKAQKRVPGGVCVDSLEIPLLINVAEPTLTYSNEIPNVFTPNEDGINDYFRVSDVSIGSFDIKIFNRFGRIVHKYEGDIRAWPGWDGKILNTDKTASTGVYYFVIKALDALGNWETGETPDLSGKNLRRGAIHLYK